MKQFGSSIRAKIPGRQLVTLSLLSVVMALTLIGCATMSAAVREASSQITGKVAYSSSPPMVGTLKYAPAMFGSPFDPTPVPTATPSPTATSAPAIGAPLPAPTAVVAYPPVDFEAARAKAQAQGKDLAFVEIGFHRGLRGNASGWGDYIRQLNDAGVPIFVKSVDNAGPLFEVQQLMKQNEQVGRNVPHVLVYRATGPRYEDMFYNLALSPEQAAAINWQVNRDAAPKELDKNYYWLETLNEPSRYGRDGNLHIERLARFSLAVAKLAVAEGYKYAALSFEVGVPEVGGWPDYKPGANLPNDWEAPAMLEFLRYAGAHRDQVAIALHEYSLTTDGAAVGYPYLIGRFQALFDTVDRHGIPRPTVLITEWGWEYGAVPEPEKALEDIAWASRLYAAYPQVLGAAIWYLGGPWCCNIDNQTQRLIEPLTGYAKSHYFIIDPGIGRIDPSLFAGSFSTQQGLTLNNLPTPFPRPQIPTP